jgi:hypothetical protein
VGTANADGGSGRSIEEHAVDLPVISEQETQICPSKCGGRHDFVCLLLRLDQRLQIRRAGWFTTTTLCTEETSWELPSADRAVGENIRPMLLISRFPEHERRCPSKVWRTMSYRTLQRKLLLFFFFQRLDKVADQRRQVYYYTITERTSGATRGRTECLMETRRNKTVDLPYSTRGG